ncbi:uncharacterized protein [Amphiura filiformis]|uniref:uncharacterized protein n=1 Tax=Amphiura filiformis TaxID=82378 RepID=UPI003B224487
MRREYDLELSIFFNMAKAMKFVIATVTVIVCACGHGGAKDCYMGQQPDPGHPKLGLRWVLPYTEDVLICTCTKILFGGMNPAPLPGSEKFVYPDDPLTLVNNDNVTELREKVRCSVADSTKAAVVSSTSQTIIKSESSTQGQLTTEVAVESTTSQVTTNPGSTSAAEQLTTEAAVESTTSQVTTNLGSTSADSAIEQFTTGGIKMQLISIKNNVRYMS